MHYNEEKVLGFFGKYRFLSNFYLTPIKYDGIIYPSVENAYQAAKTLDLEQRKQFVVCSPGQAKRLGRTVGLRKDWDKIKLSIMKQLVTEKFKNANLAKMLLFTGQAYLEETNNWGDEFWGVYRKNGKNYLGKILMRVRDELSGNALEHKHYV
jgi:ribA/ribD-fused uncharacterized protein